LLPHEASPTPKEDMPGGRFAEAKEGFGEKEVSLEGANEFFRIIQQSSR